MERMFILFLFVGISIGVFLSAYAKYCMNYFLFGEHKARKWFLAISLYGVGFLAVLASYYILNLTIFGSYNTRPGRIAFVLFWLVPFGTTVIIQIMKNRRRA